MKRLEVKNERLRHAVSDKTDVSISGRDVKWRKCVEVENKGSMLAGASESADQMIVPRQQRSCRPLTSPTFFTFRCFHCASFEARRLQLHYKIPVFPNIRGRSSFSHPSNQPPKSQAHASYPPSTWRNKASTYLKLSYSLSSPSSYIGGTPANPPQMARDRLRAVRCGLTPLKSTQ